MATGEYFSSSSRINVREEAGIVLAAFIHSFSISDEYENKKKMNKPSSCFIFILNSSRQPDRESAVSSKRITVGLFCVYHITRL